MSSTISLETTSSILSYMMLNVITWNKSPSQITSSSCHPSSAHTDIDPSIHPTNKQVNEQAYNSISIFNVALVHIFAKVVIFCDIVDGKAIRIHRKMEGGMNSNNYRMRFSNTATRHDSMQQVRCSFLHFVFCAFNDFTVAAHLMNEWTQ